MAAPSTTVWGSAVTESTSAAKIGIYVALAGTGATSSTVTATIQVWLASKWSLLDSSYSFYFDNEATSASTKISDVPKINVTVATGSGWSESNQVKLYETSFTFTRSSSDKTISCAAKLKDIDRFSGKTMTVSTSYTIPALTAYTVSFNANGGTGAPSAMTKYRGVNLVLPTTVPTRSGYTFVGWATSSTATTATHQPGYNFGIDANTILYAVWSTSTFTVTYNANGDSVSNMPSNQTKNAGSTLILSSTKPTRTDYTFVGWGTSATATTASYQPGGSYTANASITLYAIWKSNFNAPRIENLKLYRVAEDDTASPPTADDAGTCLYVYFEWSTDFTPSVVGARFKTTDATDWTACKFKASDEFTSTELANKSGVISTTLTKSDLLVELDPDTNYDFGVIVTDEKGMTEITRTLTGSYYTIDFLNGGKGIAIGKSAENEGLDIAMDTNINADLYVNGVSVDGKRLTLYGYNSVTSTANDTVSTWKAFGTSYHYFNASYLTDQPTTYGFVLNIVYGNNVHQIWLTQANGVMAHRGGNANGWSGTWRINLDNSNYNSYALPLSGGTTTGFVKLGNTINTIGYMRQHTTWLGFYTSPSYAQAGGSTNRYGWIGVDTTSDASAFNVVSKGSIIVNSGTTTYTVTKGSWANSSDQRLKKNITDIPDVCVDIWKELQPKVFQWKDVAEGVPDKYHFGLIAQDVVAAFEKYGLDYKEYGFVNSYTSPDDNAEYFAIAYDEYHVLSSLVAKKQQEKIDSLEERIEKLEKLILGQEE